MNQQEVKSQLKEIFQQIAPEIPFNELDTTRPLRDQAEIDSFDFYQVIVQVAERTGVNVPDSKLAEMKNLDQLIGYVADRSS